MRSRIAETLGLVAVLGAIGCGKSAQKNPDGGDGSLTSPDGPAAGWRSFDVVAVLANDGSTAIPPTNRFTLVRDLTALRVIAGGNGRASVVPVSTGDGRTFHSAGSFTVGDMTMNACSGPQEVRYDSFDFTITGGSLTGTATGAASISCGDCSFFVPITATLTGTADETVPTLRAAGEHAVTPFDPIWLAASEPLPAGVTAKLVADDGASIDLVPQVLDGDLPVVVAFYKPAITLRTGQGYVVTLDGLVDFAGLSDADTPLRITSFPAAPTVAEDGFESATGASLGGAMVVTAAQMPPIAGNTSLYVGPPGAPGIVSTNGASLAVRLARQPGDTKLRFSYRVIAAASQGSFFGTLLVGSEGAPSGQTASGFAGMAPSAQEPVTVGGKAAYASAVTVMEQPLAADTTDSVLVLITPGSDVCRAGPLLNAGVLMDDLRLE
jgi:hypothetical protein